MPIELLNDVSLFSQKLTRLNFAAFSFLTRIICDNWYYSNVCNSFNVAFRAVARIG